jgi:hypothetical protein
LFLAKKGKSLRVSGLPTISVVYEHQLSSTTSAVAVAVSSTRLRANSALMLKHASYVSTVCGI